MVGEVAAIPTVYNGIRYRSILEAHWAAFFEFLGWVSEYNLRYEPTALPGWIPDFVLYGDKSQVLVEVKPTATFSDDIAKAAMAKAEKAMVNSAYDGALLVGCAPLLLVGSAAAVFDKTVSGLMAMGIHDFGLNSLCHVEYKSKNLGLFYSKKANASLKRAREMMRRESLAHGEVDLSARLTSPWEDATFEYCGSVSGWDFSCDLYDDGERTVLNDRRAGRRINWQQLAGFWDAAQNKVQWRGKREE